MAKNKQKREKVQQPITEPIRDYPLEYPTWGRRFIDPQAVQQMDNAMRLPISVAGALMPDAHVGYGLPIGGVLAVDDAVIPYAVGVDIACRVRASLYDAPPQILGQKSGQFEKSLMEQTRFGAGAKWNKGQRPHHDVLDDSAWEATRFLKSLKDTAYDQLGTSGTGNHFVEWGSCTVHMDLPDLGVKAGEYLILLSHSGSRGVGFKIANTYSQIAMDTHPGLDPAVRHLGWLSMRGNAGQEYWLSMELAGRFAQANHEVIHQQVAKAVGLKAVAAIENHHNYAWREAIVAPEGYDQPTREVYVHRKGATPAGKGVYGIIPGSMGDVGYLVRGQGNPASLNSAAHGAGRAMSRKAAIGAITKTERDRYLKEHNVTLLGGGLDEAPQAYKRIEDVIGAQGDLVEIVATFRPLVVRMANEPGDN